MISKLIIHNFKTFRDFSLNLSPELSILVGDNEAGKSTILEAINLALTRRINGRLLESELTPFIINSKAASEFILNVKQNNKPVPPEIYIELYFDNSQGKYNTYKGSNNSLKQDEAGVKIELLFDDNYKDEYEKFINAELEDISLLPIEYYKVEWTTFSGVAITARSIPIKPSFIDASNIRLQSGTDYYLHSIIDNGLNSKEKVELNISYRSLKETFSKKDSITAINKKLNDSKGSLSDKELSIGLDLSQKSSWESNLIPHLDTLPFHLSGKGEQSALKIMLALEKNGDDATVILIEEPENHLSYSSMNILLRKVVEKCKGKQIIISTHSSFVLNKLGLNNLVLIRNSNKTYFSGLPLDTYDYFKKLPGYDTLRLVLAKKAILVEGPSDELIVQKAYWDKHKKLPIENGVDVINVRGLSFKRFLDIAIKLKNDVVVVTDNDGDYQTKVVNKYSTYIASNIKICFDKDNKYITLEPQLVKVNKLDILNKVFGTSYTDTDALTTFMTENKTECALKLFETKESIVIPSYINDAIA